MRLEDEYDTPQSISDWEILQQCCTKSYLKQAIDVPFDGNNYALLKEMGKLARIYKKAAKYIVNGVTKK